MTIWRIARHEWRVLRAEPAAWIAGALLVLCASYAALNGAAWRAGRTADGERILADVEADLAEQRAAAAAADDGAGGEVYRANQAAVLPPGPLADFAVGQSDLYPDRAQVSVFKRLDNLFGWYQLASPFGLLAGRFDLAFVVIYLLPLVVLGLSYDLLSREREGGTLALTLAQPVTLRALVVGKLAARLLAGGGLLAAILGAAFAAGGDFGGARWARFGLWLALAAAYALFWLVLAAATAAAGWRSETNATVLAVAWLLLVLVVPGLLTAAIQAALPAPPRLEFVSALRRADNEAAGQSAALLARYYHEHPELAAAGEQGGFVPRYYAAQREVDRRVMPVVEAFERRLEAQQELVGRLRFLSPGVVAQEAFNDLAGSSAARHRRFTEQARDYLARWHAVLSPRIFLGRPLAPEEYDDLPRFAFAEERLGAVATRALAGLAGLLGLTAVPAAWGWRRLARYPLVGRPDRDRREP
jgi:ABC-2 type transport system permease protein